MRQTIGHYRVLEKLGEGGMGVVYSARDERLDRPVALKMIKRAAAGDERARERFWREARSAASVNHPNICQIYEVGEEEGELFIAMELLEGQPLDKRLLPGGLSISDAVEIALPMLSALEALHARGLVHRDLKPSNVFLTPHAVKLLDFGLARPSQAEPDETRSDLTQPGVLMGTPHYMAPEQVLGRPIDARADLFAAGAIIFEMLAGKRAFDGDTLIDVTHAILHDRPPVLTGSAAIAAIDRVIHRALAKKPGDRFQRADLMAQDIREAMALGHTGEVPKAHAMSRLVVLPFRVLRPDPDTDFLSFGLADALTMSLSGLDSLIVRSTLAATRFAGPVVDLRALSTELDVDSVLAGSLLRSGDQLRVSAQLLEAPGGTVLWSQTSQVAMGELFQLQDSLAHQIVKSLEVPLSAHDRSSLVQDVPASAKAYEFYLRANELSNSSTTWALSRDLYLKAVEEDPKYAPAWARLARMYRVLGKFVDGDPVENDARAAAAVGRALELNPDLSIAHRVQAQLDIEAGRGKEAMVRVIARLRMRRSDAELYPALVQSCRYCGLLKASVAAAEQANRLDPQLPTSVLHTLWAAGEYEKALDDTHQVTDTIRGLVLASLGRREEGIEELRKEEERFVGTTMLNFSRLARAVLEQDTVTAVSTADALIGTGLKDPEGIFYIGMMMAGLDAARALGWIDRAVSAGFYCYPALARTSWLDPVRTNPEFIRIMRGADERHREARAAFLEAGGEIVLGHGTAQ